MTELSEEKLLAVAFESAYRRGYQQGAFTALTGAWECVAAPEGWEALWAWMEDELSDWRGRSSEEAEEPPLAPHERV